MKKKRKKKEDNKNNKFAILIAARNEELVIGKLIESLNKQNYPKEFFDIFVIVNNSSDNTLEVSLKSGAKVLNCPLKVKSKGEALKYAFNELDSHDDIDAYIIFDADNIVSCNFLYEMNKIINQGYKVAQGFRDTKNISDNWLSSSYAILYYVQSLFINQLRSCFGKSSYLNGTGFMVKKEVIDKYGFDMKTITEDVEFTIACAINDEKIAFARKAITYDEQVTDFKTSIKQRKRWSYGQMECMKKYFLELMKTGIKEKRFECFDLALFSLVIIGHVLISLILFFLLGSMILKNSFFSLESISSFLGIILIPYLLGVLVRIFIIKFYKKRIRDNIGGILLFDLFVLSWLPINVICLFIKDCNWEPIKHNRNIDVENI